MSDSFELQKAVIAYLRAYPDLTALVSSRVYDSAPPDASLTFPYLTLGPEDIIPERADRYDGSDITFQIDAWSRAVGFPEVKKIIHAVRAALSSANLVVAGGYRLVDIYPTATRTMRDEDGITNHGIITIRARTEPV